MKSTESDVSYFEVDAVFNREPVELLEESTWTAGLRRTGNNTGKEVLGFLPLYSEMSMISFLHQAVCTFFWHGLNKFTEITASSPLVINCLQNSFACAQISSQHL